MAIPARLVIGTPVVRSPEAEDLPIISSVSAESPQPETLHHVMALCRDGIRTCVPSSEMHEA